MMSIKNAKRAVELNDQRESLINRANAIRLADKPCFAGEQHNVPVRMSGGAGYHQVTPAELTVEVFADEFRALVAKELKAQVAELDKELRKLGVEPDALELAERDEHNADDKVVEAKAFRPKTAR